MEENFCAFDDLQYGVILIITSKSTLATLDEALFGVRFDNHING
jgi:hypothetical protein